MPPRPKPILRDHVAAAKQLLAELDLHANVIAKAIGQDDGTKVLAAVEQRGRVLAELDVVTQSMARAGSWQNGQPPFSQLLTAASAAQESQDQLFLRVRGERDRLSTALDRNRRPDLVADRYAATRGSGRGTISVAV
jgi:hypothetical protein